MGSKKHKKHKSDRREKYEEYSNNMDPAQLQRSGALKLILKVGSNSTPEYDGNSPLAAGPPTAAEAMMSDAPLSPNMPNELIDAYRSEKHKKSKKKKKKKDREKKHKHHKVKRHRSGVEHKRNVMELQQPPDDSLDHLTECATNDVSMEEAGALGVDTVYTPQCGSKMFTEIDAESSQDAFSLLDEENSQPLAENILMYTNITTDNSPSCRPVSKPIVPLKIDDLLADSQASSSAPSSVTMLSLSVSGTGAVIGSPIKPLPDLLIPSPSPSTQASTPGTSLTPKALEAPKTPSTSSESGREPRTCVLKLKQQKTPLNKLLDHLLRFLEKRDPHQFFAWPVTDDIAPGYSSIITKPMDFSTMRQKIDDSEYTTLSEFRDDFKLMCENAIRYNHVDTVYNKAAKRLMQIGMKHLQPENLMRTLKPLASYLREITSKELGFELLPNETSNSYEPHSSLDSADEGTSTGNDEPSMAQQEAEEKRRALRAENEPKTRFEPYIDDMTSEEILAQVQAAAQSVKKKLSAKERAHEMGFLRQNKDGTTSLQLLIKEENEGPEKVVNIGDLVGKLKTGSGQIHGLRLDKRNDAKVVKPLYYGPFTSFAPTLDSRFSNLNPEETKLVLNTYGDASSAEYAESILQFSKDSDYASRLANSLLDILTNGDHSKSMAELYDMQLQNYEEQEMLKCFNTTYSTAAVQAAEARQKIEEEYEKYKNTRIDFNRLRTLKELGIDVGFLDSLEEEVKSFELTRRLQEHLSNNLTLIEKLRNTQHERLSQSLPEHLAHVPQAGAEETHVAHQLTQQLTDLAKKLPPMAIADSYAIRKAMGVSFVGLPSQTQSLQRLPLPDLLQHPVAMPQLNLPDTLMNNSSLPEDNHAQSHANSMSAMDIDEGSSLEHELREFLESGPDLNTTNNTSDDNIVAQLLMN